MLDARSRKIMMGELEKQPLLCSLPTANMIGKVGISARVVELYPGIIVG